MTGEHIAILITAIVAGIGSLLGYRATAKKAGLDYLNTVMQSLEDRYKRLSDDFCALSIENAKLREQVTRLTNEVCDVRAENAQLKARMTDQDSKITALEEENVSLRDELEKYRPTRKPKAGV